MSEYHEMAKEAAEARIGADRMTLGLPCIPDPLRGDMAVIERLRTERYSPVAWAERGRLLVEAAIFLDQLAKWLEVGGVWNTGHDPAADCRKMAERLRK